MTRPELKKILSEAKRQCMASNGVTEVFFAEEVGSIEQGEFLEERNVMCYIKCIYVSGGVIKKDIILHDAMIKHVEKLWPQETKASIIDAINHCRYVDEKYADACEDAYWMARCIQAYTPEHFLFP
ncbi:uncharacterized protein LOC125489912 [Plutella xylostella]|uniref:uncharacterized protein LOC125489912 n=1 Tax=Plutella xylostella TaxID=51655 RepID=UPI00203247B3|nr:uncharacterized protein LOC125489912 [Plutella xylostella]